MNTHTSVDRKQLDDLLYGQARAELAHAQNRLAYYLAKPPYKTKNSGSFGWAPEITFWRAEAERLLPLAHVGA